MPRFITHTRLATLSVVVVLPLPGAAVAYWTGAASSSSTANTGAIATVWLTASVPDGITPGGREPVSFTATNPGNSPIHVSRVHLKSISVDRAHASCVTTDFSMADVTENGDIPAGSAAVPLLNDGTLAYADPDVNQDACKGATLTLTLLSH